MLYVSNAARAGERLGVWMKLLPATPRQSKLLPANFSYDGDRHSNLNPVRPIRRFTSLWLLAAVGFVTGAIQFLLCLTMAGAGHGIFAPLAIMAAPASLFNDIPLSWLGCLGVPIFVSVLASTRAFPLIACLYYISGVVASFLPQFQDGHPNSKTSIAGLVVLTILVFLLWQWFLWRTWSARRQ